MVSGSAVAHLTLVPDGNACEQIMQYPNAAYILSHVVDALQLDPSTMLHVLTFIYNDRAAESLHQFTSDWVTALVTSEVGLDYIHCADAMSKNQIVYCYASANPSLKGDRFKPFTLSQVQQILQTCDCDGSRLRQVEWLWTNLDLFGTEFTANYTKRWLLVVDEAKLSEVAALLSRIPAGLRLLERIFAQVADDCNVVSEPCVAQRCLQLLVTQKCLCPDVESLFVLVQSDCWVHDLCKYLDFAIN